MLEHLIEIARGRAADRAKAHAYLAEHAASSFREMLADYDAFVPHVAQIEEPALLLGTAKDSSDAESPVRLPWEEIFCHWLVQGGTGTGKTTFVTLLVSSALREGQAIGVVDCKSGFFDQGVLWAGRACNSTPNTRNSALDDALDQLTPPTGLSHSGCTKNAPTRTNTASGTSLAIVNVFTAIALCLIPMTFR